MLTHSLLKSDIFWPRIRTCLYLKMLPLVLSKAIELSLVTLWQVRTCSIAVCLSLPSHSWFPKFRVSLFFFCVGPRILSWGFICYSIKIFFLILHKNIFIDKYITRTDILNSRMLCSVTYALQINLSSLPFTVLVWDGFHEKDQSN